MLIKTGHTHNKAEETVSRKIDKPKSRKVQP